MAVAFPLISEDAKIHKDEVNNHIRIILFHVL